MLSFSCLIYKPRLWSLVFLFVVFVFLNIPSASASNQAVVNNRLWSDQANAIQNQTGLGNVSPQIIVARVINIVLGFLGIISIILIMYAGFLWMNSGGNSDKINQAKRILIGAVIGLIIILSSFAIAAFVLRALYDATNGGNGHNPLPPGCLTPPCTIPVPPPCIGPNCNNNPYAVACSSDPDTCTADQSICNPLGPLWACNTNTCFCEVTNMGSCYNATDDVCNYPCKVGLGCYGAGGCEDNLPANSCGQGNTSCHCCCDPANDQCNKIYPSLSCRPDISPCDSASRGMCCGCQADAECGGGNGCGDDTCCRSRPVAGPVIPANASTNVCTNAMIQIEFDQAMKSETFADNILLIGEYSVPCPSYTKLVDTTDPSIPIAFVAGINYCSIDGGFGARNDAKGFHVFYALSHFMDPDTIYHVVVRGDLDVNDEKNQGIESYWGISMAGSFASSFTTIKDTNGTGGVCVIDRVLLTPSSYLFRTTLNSVREDDALVSGPTFDIDKDGDKLFVASALSDSNQALASIPGYQWLWDINSSVVTVVRLIFTMHDIQPGEVLAKAVEGVTDGRSTVSAVVNMSSFSPGSAPIPNITMIGDGLSARSLVYVFVCENPWPPVDETAAIMWRPWEPAPNPYNFDIYYCRDKGKKGTADDLPAFDSAGTPASSNPVDILQQIYFSYQVPPAPGSIISATPISNNSYPDGGAVSLTWVGAVVGSGITGFKVYWGESSGVYKFYKDVKSVTSADIDGLNNGQSYYFSMTAYTGDKAESSYYPELNAVPIDQFAPTTTPMFIANEIKVSKNEIELSWTEEAGIDTYELSYGFNSGPFYGMEINMGSDTEAIIRGLSANKMYYFGIRGVDGAGNKRDYDQNFEFSTTTLAN